MELKGKKIAFLGDSITEGCGTSAITKRFSELIAANESCTCYNHGIGGTRIARQQQPSGDTRMDLDYCLRVEELEKDSDIIVVFGGTNDYGHGDADFGTVADTTPDTFCGAVNYLCKRLLERFCGKKIVIMTPIHRDWEEVQNFHGKTLKDYVDVIRERAEYYSIPVLDTYATSCLQPAVPFVRENFMPDGLHPNDAGHKMLSEQITAFLKAM